MKAESAHRWLEELRRRASSSSDPTADEALEALHTVLEELRVSQEELEESHARLEAEHRRYQELFHLAPDAYLVTGGDGVIREANQAAADLLNVSDTALAGKPLAVFISDADRPAFRARLLDLVGAGRTDEWEFAIRPRNREPVHTAATVAVTPGIKSGQRLLRWLLRDITDRKQVEESNRLLEGEQAARREAEEARSEAVAANRAKSEFLANMSHEIRTPINAIIGYTDLMEIGVGGPLTAKQRQHLARIRTSSTHLIGLVDEILDLAKVESGRMAVEREHARIGDVAAAALALVGPQAAERGVEITSRCDEVADVLYLGDEVRVRQILANLLSNAAKFTEAGGRIVVTCGASTEPDAPAQLPPGDKWVFVRVEDTGIGIEPKKLAAVFEPFVQAQMGHTRTHSGTGLGLTISRQFARLMGGEITVRSIPGKGSIFTLWLPAAGAEGGDGTERVHPAEREAHLADLGEALVASVESVTRAYADRLRADPGVPHAALLSDAELEDHAPTFLADIAQALVIVGGTGGGAERDMLRDGSDIQRLISERHGAQRARYGWTEAMLQREFAILAEEVERGVRRAAPADSEELEAALRLLRHLVERAEQISVRGLRHALQAVRRD